MMIIAKILVQNCSLQMYQIFDIDYSPNNTHVGVS